MSILPACLWPLFVLFRNFSTNSMTQFPEVTPKYYLCRGLHPREPQVWRGSRQVWNSFRLVRLLFIASLRFILPIWSPGLRVSWISWNCTTIHCKKSFTPKSDVMFQEGQAVNFSTSMILINIEVYKRDEDFPKNSWFSFATLTWPSKCDWEICCTFSVTWRSCHIFHAITRYNEDNLFYKSLYLFRPVMWWLLSAD